MKVGGGKMSPRNFSFLCFYFFLVESENIADCAFMIALILISTGVTPQSSVRISRILSSSS